MRLFLFLLLSSLAFGRGLCFRPDYVYVEDQWADSYLEDIQANRQSYRFLIYDPNGLPEATSGWNIRVLRYVVHDPNSVVIVRRFTHQEFLLWFCRHWLEPYTLQTFNEFARWWKK